MRNKILTDGELRTFIDFGDYKIFEQAGIQTMVYSFEKQTPRKAYILEYLRIDDKNISEENVNLIDQQLIVKYLLLKCEQKRVVREIVDGLVALHPKNQ